MEQNRAIALHVELEASDHVDAFRAFSPGQLRLFNLAAHVCFAVAVTFAAVWFTTRLMDIWLAAGLVIMGIVLRTGWFIIPKRFFSSDADIEAFCELASRRLSGD